MTLPQQDIDQLVEGSHQDPFSVLGLHKIDNQWIVRALVRGAHSLTAFDNEGKQWGPLSLIHPQGLFEGAFPLCEQTPLTYRAERKEGEAKNEWLITDPYSFAPILGPIDDHLFSEGSHKRLFDILGAHLKTHQGHEGVHFALWAPNALRVAVVGDFNHWDPRPHGLRKRHSSGLWEIFIPHIGPGSAYKYHIIGASGEALPLKSDPYAQASELRPSTASKIPKPISHIWGDKAHQSHWSKVDPRREPISIYEVHAGSWRRHWDGGFLNWDELAAELIPYVVGLGFTHIEFLPIMEHPYDPSWGYQTTGLYAPSARFGDPEGLARLIDAAHRAGIGILLDWVPAHFPMDAHGLIRFDGTHLYEHEDPRLGYHPDWTTAIYNLDRTEVSSFLINNALYWAERYHVDGLRVDAVASMLYRDYSRKEGQWLPNADGGRENWESMRFLQKFNMALYGAGLGSFSIAEESTSWPQVSQPVHAGGLGFGFKWNMGFMNDSLNYMQKDPIHRSWHYHEITFGLTYAFSENFVLPISHDEVVHGKGTLLTRMPGSDWEQFANVRAYLGFMWGYPGKKLLFMGQEWAQRREWSEERGLDWSDLENPYHQGMQGFVTDLNRVYRENPSLFARDCEPEGFEWVQVDDPKGSVFGFVRKTPDQPPILVVSNFSGQTHYNYELSLPENGYWREILNSDSFVYGGSNTGNAGGIWAENHRTRLVIPRLSSLYFIFEANHKTQDNSLSAEQSVSPASLSKALPKQNITKKKTDRRNS